jgi:hypothetical protein
MRDPFIIGIWVASIVLCGLLYWLWYLTVDRTLRCCPEFMTGTRRELAQRFLQSCFNRDEFFSCTNAFALEAGCRKFDRDFPLSLGF